MEDNATVQLSAPATSSRTAKQMATRRATGPTKKLQGISIPIHVLDLVREIVEVENEAFIVMGGQTKGSVSDHVNAALEGYVRDWLSDNGSIPSTGSKEARREYVKKLAARNLEKLREQLLTKQ